MPPGAAAAMAVSNDPAVPTASMTWCEPPPVISRTRAAASSPRSVTRSVAPKSRAISMRSA